MTMRRTSFFVLFIFIVLFASGCGTIVRTAIRDVRRTDINMAPELPEEQTAVVTISEVIEVYAYNGIDVSKTWHPKRKNRVVKAVLPSGETALSLNLHAEFTVGNTIYISDIEDVEVRYNFEAGKEYTIGMYAKRTEDSNFLFPRYKILLVIWGKTFPGGAPISNFEDSLLRSWELGEI